MMNKIHLLDSTKFLPRKGPDRANRTNSATKGVPMGRISWQTQQPGHFEVDLVDRCIIVVGVQQESTPTHCRWWRPQGGGHRVEATGWSERVAVLGRGPGFPATPGSEPCKRGQRAMQEGLTSIKERLPFAVKELHPDNGPEFFNDLAQTPFLIRLWGEEL